MRNANTTNVRIRGERWCVAATALVNTLDEKRFEKELNDLKTNTAKPISVSNVHLVIDDQ